MEHYTPEFRQDAVSLVLSSGRAIKEIARELGINDTTLGNWVRAERKRTGLTGSAPAADNAEMEENRRLKRRVAELEKEREILKRATAFWVKESNA
ncbi:MAG: transposase [Actinomycetota bacterium]